MAALALAALLAARAEAQDPVQIGAGLTVPSGDFAGGYALGYHVGVRVLIPRLIHSLGLRIDGTFHTLPEEFSDGNSQLLACTLNGVFDLTPPAPRGNGARLYAVAGTGYYGRHASIGGGWSSGLGIQAGMGVRGDIVGLLGVVEAKVTKVFASRGYRFFPISVAVRF